MSVARTMVRGMSDHVVLPVARPWMARHPGAIRQVLHFLRCGRFAQVVPAQAA